MITTILTCYKRLDYLKDQISSIENQSIPPKDIWIWYNNPEDGSQVDLNKELKGKYRVVQSNHNFSFFGRFALATLAQTKYIAMFDDDTIPGCKWFENCMSTITSGHDGILGCSGIRLMSTNYSNHHKVGWNGKGGLMEVDLVGHSWFFDKNHLKYFFMEEPISFENAEDIHFGYMCQKHGNISSYVPDQTGEKSNLGSTKGHLYGDDAYSSYQNRKTNSHSQIRDSVVLSHIQDGWVNDWRVNPYI